MISIKLSCSDCSFTEQFQAETPHDALVQAHVEGWMTLLSAPVSNEETVTRLAQLCARCFARIQFKMNPPLTALFGGQL